MNDEPPNDRQTNFWGNARDVCFIGFAIFILMGLTYTFFFLRAFAIPMESIELSSAKVAVSAMGLVVRHFVLLASAVVIVAIAAILRVFLAGHIDRHHLGPTLLVLSANRVAQGLAVVILGILLSVIAALDAKSDAHDLRDGKVATINHIVFRPEAVNLYPQELIQEDKEYSLIPIAETGDTAYVLYQRHSGPKLKNGNTEYPKGDVFAISKHDIVLITTSIQEYVSP